MSKIELKNAEGKAAGTVELDSSVFGIEPNIPVIHQVVTVQLGNLRQGTHDTKGRSEVSGGGGPPGGPAGDRPGPRRGPAGPPPSAVLLRSEIFSKISAEKEEITTRMGIRN